VKAEYQLDKQIEVGTSVANFSEAGGVTSSSGKKLDALKGTGNWTEEDMREYLEEYRAYALKTGVGTLKYVTDESGESLGMSLGMNFDEATEAQMRAYINGLIKLGSDLADNKTEKEKTASDARIVRYTM
jgi:hypothetical protein